jgi:hypothetical protein
MAYIGRGIENLVNTQKLDVITPSTATGAGPYNLTKASVAFVPASADQLIISINGVIQYGNFTVNSSTVTFDAALTDSDVCDFIYQMGTGLLTTPVDGSVNTAQLADDAVTTAKILDSNVTNSKLAGSIENAKLTNSSITINGSAVSLGGSVTIGETKPTITSVSPDTIENTQTSITVTGTNFVNGANIEAIATNGAIVQADTVTFNSATSISANFTITTDGTYYLRIENPDGNAVRSSTALSLGSMAAGTTANFTIAATSDSAVTYSIVSGALPGGLSLNSSTGAITGTESGATAETTYNFTARATDSTGAITGTESGTTAETTYSFTARATDAEAQTADRAFSITVTVSINNSGGFN